MLEVDFQAPAESCSTTRWEILTLEQWSWGEKIMQAFDTLSIPKPWLYHRPIFGIIHDLIFGIIHDLLIGRC